MGGHKGHLISISLNSCVDNKHAILYTYRIARNGCSFYMKLCEQPLLVSMTEQTVRGADISIKGARLRSCLQAKLVHCKPVWFQHVSWLGMAVVAEAVDWQLASAYCTVIEITSNFRKDLQDLLESNWTALLFPCLRWEVCVALTKGTFVGHPRLQVYEYMVRYEKISWYKPGKPVLCFLPAVHMQSTLLWLYGWQVRSVSGLSY